MTRGPVEALARALAAQVPAHRITLDPRADGMALEAHALELQFGESPSPEFLLLWRQRPCIAIPRNFARRSGFAAAAAASGAAGWPVALRMTGGTAVAQHEGVLNVSLIGVDRWASIDAAFEALAALVGSALAGFGLDLDAGRVEGACCDGRFNLRWRGRKLAGTAGAIRSRRGRRATLVHAALVVDADLRRDLAAVERLEHGLGLHSAYAVAAHVTLAEALAGRISEGRRRRPGRRAGPPASAPRSCFRSAG